jgi:hypothetical protein
MTQEQAIELADVIQQQIKAKNAIRLHQIANGDWIVRVWSFFYVWSLEDWQQAEKPQGKLKAA